MHRKNITRRSSHATIKSEVLGTTHTISQNRTTTPSSYRMYWYVATAKKAKAEGLKLRGPHTRSPTHTHNE